MRRLIHHSLFNFLALLFIVSVTTAQEIKVSGGFQADSIRIGETIPFSLTVHYPQHINVLFPDSTFNFEPFEFASKKFFPTRTTNGISYDSVLYFLTTFEIDKVQHLRLPVFVTTAKDCTTYLSSPDSVFLIELVKDPPSDSVAANNLPLKTNTFYERVLSEFNYIIVLIVATVIGVLSLIIWIAFGKKILRYLKVKKLTKKHHAFVDEFTAQINKLNTGFSRDLAEQTLSHWKKYMEQLEQLPYTKLTTRETTALLPDGNLKSNLQLLDRAIYGNQTAVVEPLQNLQKIAEEHFHKKLEIIANG